MESDLRMMDDDQLRKSPSRLANSVIGHGELVTYFPC